MSLIDNLGAERRDALRQLADRIGASDDTAVMAWAAWQTFAGMGDAERTQALSLVIAFSEIHRQANGLPPLFVIEKRGAA